MEYIQETCPKTVQLMDAVQTGDLELARPLLEKDASEPSSSELRNMWRDALRYIFVTMYYCDLAIISQP
jgi:hypothetical protein